MISKKMKVCVLIAALLLVFSGCALKRVKEDDVGKVSRPLEYSGYSFLEYKGFERTSQYVEMSDGVKLAVDIYFPTEGPERKSFPVVFRYTPYQRAYMDLNDNPVWGALRKAFFHASGPVIDETLMSGMPGLLLSHGYVYVVADMRGTGASYGWKMDLMPRIGQDGGELVNWIARQSWCDGNVGMFGSSYRGYSQLVTASQNPPALKCIFPELIFFDGYSGIGYPGGIHLAGFFDVYSEGLKRLNLNYYRLNIRAALAGTDITKLSIPAPPVVDEDSDGELIDEIPLDLNGNGTFLDDYGYPDDPSDEPRYADGKEREHIYFLATYEHKRNIDLKSWVAPAMFADAEPPEEFSGLKMYDISPSGHVKNIMESGIPVYHRGAWFDGFTRDTILLYSTMKDANPNKMMIDAGYHHHSGKSPYWKYMGEKWRRQGEKIDAERLRFFDRYLKGIENGIENDPPVLIYVMNGDGWRTENEWPLARQVETGFYLSEGNGLSKNQGDPGSDDYTADYTHDSSYGSTDANRYTALYSNVPNKLPIRTAKDKQCLLYETKPMKEDMEVTGHPMMNLWVSSTADYGDFFVYLVDVDRTGKAVLVTEGMLRAGFAGLYDNDLMVYAGKTDVEVLPELPWHGYERKHYKDRVLADGNIVELVFDLQPTSWVFRKGHRIRVVIACANWPTFRLHEKLAPANRPDDPANIIPTITVHRDEEHPSRIILPVIPGQLMSSRSNY